MEVALAQVTALVAHGNAALAGDADAGARVESGSTFRFVRSIRFDRQAGQPPASEHVETSVGAWFQRLRDWGVTALWSDPRPMAVPTLAPHLLAAWTNGSRASIVTEGRRRDRWISTWSIAAVPTETDRRAWAVDCVGRPDIANLATRRSIAEVHAELEANVRAARELAQRYAWTFWAGWFDRSLEAAASEIPRPSYHDDLLPPSAELDRWRLVTLACTSHVFGGMGTWNDIGPPDEAGEAEYQKITAALYASVMEGMATAANPRAG